MDQLLDIAVMLHPHHSTADQAHMARLASRLGFSAVHVPLADDGMIDAQALDEVMAAAEPAMVVVDDGADVVGVVRRNDPDEVRRVRTLLDSQEDGRPLIVAVPLSIGRTLNEAEARADRDPRFVGDAHPRECGIFGTFEQAQEQVLDLARAGAEVLLVTVPDERDVADVLAQVRALVVGATPALFER
jgi:alkanesulfonate monooxygenase SsuD/methylene tetrahydromethanopterin reductase-like flavin-dependent oxidoreductase (luciferase family)